MTSEASQSPKVAPSSPDQRRRAVVALLLAAAIVAVVFGVILPQIIDYSAVWDTLSSIRSTSLLVLLSAGLVYLAPQGALFAASMPGMSWWQGIKVWVASVGVGSTLPGLDFVLRFGMYRSYGFSVAASTRGMFVSGAVDWTVKFALPVVAGLVLLVAGVSAPTYIWVMVGIGAAAVAVILGVLLVTARSQRVTRWLAARVESLISWAHLRVNKEAPVGLSTTILDFRNDAVEVARQRGPVVTAASVAGKLWQFAMLTAALRAVGVPSDVLTAPEVFVVFSMVMLICMIPLTPGGIGIAELFYILFFVALAGPNWASIIAAGVMLYRVFQWVLPIPIGWIVALRWRRSIERGELATPFARSDGATEGGYRA